MDALIACRKLLSIDCGLRKRVLPSTHGILHNTQQQKSYNGDGSEPLLPAGLALPAAEFKTSVGETSKANTKSQNFPF